MINLNKDIYEGFTKLIIQKLSEHKVELTVNRSNLSKDYWSFTVDGFKDLILKMNYGIKTDVLTLNDLYFADIWVENVNDWNKEDNTFKKISFESNNFFGLNELLIKKDISKEKNLLNINFLDYFFKKEKSFFITNPKLYNYYKGRKVKELKSYEKLYNLYQHEMNKLNLILDSKVNVFKEKVRKKLEENNIKHTYFEYHNTFKTFDFNFLLFKTTYKRVNNRRMLEVIESIKNEEMEGFFTNLKHPLLESTERISEVGVMGVPWFKLKIEKNKRH